jgi:putative cardiolipin synthase
MRIILILILCLATATVHAEKLRLLVTDEDALNARADIIESAQKEILVEYYAIWNDDVAASAFAILGQAARRGVKVKVMMDAIATNVSRALLAAMSSKITDANGHQNLEIKVYNTINPLRPSTLNNRDHAKMLIVDGKILITGGRNIGDQYFGLDKSRNYRDLDVIVSGKVAEKAQQNFLKIWNNPGFSQPPDLYEFSEKFLTEPCTYQEDSSNCEQRKTSSLKRIEEQSQKVDQLLQSISSGQSRIHLTTQDWLASSQEFSQVSFFTDSPQPKPDPASEYITEGILRVFSKAQRRVTILSPYVIPTGEFLSMFQKLLQRGVKIKIITNSLNSTDNIFAQAAYRACKEQLIQMGIEIYEYRGPETTHAKTYVIDGQRAVVGTFNLDPRSAMLNREVAIAVEDLKHVKFAEEAEHLIEFYQYNSILVGKDGADQNIEEQRQRFAELSPIKRAMLKMFTVVEPAFHDLL